MGVTPEFWGRKIVGDLQFFSDHQWPQESCLNHPNISLLPFLEMTPPRTPWYRISPIPPAEVSTPDNTLQYTVIHQTINQTIHCKRSQSRQVWNHRHHNPYTATCQNPRWPKIFCCCWHVHHHGTQTVILMYNTWGPSSLWAELECQIYWQISASILYLK